MCTAAVAAGNGRHPYYLGPDQTSKAIEINSIALVPAVMAFSTPKLAVAYLLMRLLNPSKWQRWFLYFLSISCIIFAALCAILLFAQCSPVKGLWEPTLKPVCWKPSVLINWTIFTGGRCFITSDRSVTEQRSVLSFCGSIPGRISYDRTKGTANQREEKDRSVLCPGSWFEVSMLLWLDLIRSDIRPVLALSRYINVRGFRNLVITQTIPVSGGQKHRDGISADNAL